MKCLVCEKPTSTVVCIVCCAQNVCKDRDDIFEQHAVPDEDEDWLYIEWLQVRDLTDVFLEDIEASVIPFLYSASSATRDTEMQMIADAYPARSLSYQRHIFRLTHATIERLQRPQLMLFWQSMLVYGCILQKLKMPITNALRHLVELETVSDELNNIKKKAQDYLSLVPDPRINHSRRINSSVRNLTETLLVTRNCLVITLKTLNLPEGGVLQCPRCKKGPIYREQCGDMAGHHGDAYGFHSSDNRCPNPKCRYFGNSADLDWDKWDGLVRIDPSSVFPTAYCNTVKDCQYMTHTPFVVGQVPPRPPCFPFKELDGVCINQFDEIEDEKKRHLIIIRTLLGTLKRNREDEREILVRQIITKALQYASVIERDLHELKSDNPTLEWEAHTDYTDLKISFETSPGSALEWLREHKDEYDRCISESSSDMSSYADNTGIFDYAEPGLSNFYFLNHDDAHLHDEYAPDESYTFEFPISATQLLSAPLKHLQYTMNVLD